MAAATVAARGEVAMAAAAMAAAMAEARVEVAMAAEAMAVEQRPDK